jgi:hypothetical protein
MNDSFEKSSLMFWLIMSLIIICMHRNSAIGRHIQTVH